MNEKDPTALRPESLTDDLERARHLFRDLGALSNEVEGPDGSQGELDRLFLVSRDLHSTLNMSDLLPRVLDLAIAHAGAERGILFYFDPKTGQSLPWATRGVDDEAVSRAEAYSRTVLDEARAGAVLTENAVSDPRFKDAESVRLQQIRSVLSVPIVASGRTIGALYLDNLRTETRFSESAVRFVAILASLSALAIQNAEKYRELTTDCERMRRDLQRLAPFTDIVGRSRPMQELLRGVERVARTNFSVVLLGESGSGKELVARALHRSSPRANGPFIAQNCAAIPADLLESEFFGHTRGAFTGAHVEREGLFRLAHGGTLFLDEIADLDGRLQAKLLRVLEDGAVRPLGSGVETRFDVRVLTATSRDLRAAVAQGHFRQDLYYRLNAVTLRVPPVRERSADIPLLLRHFLGRHALEGEVTPWFTPAAMKALQRCRWPGNVRELEHFAKRSLVLSDRKLIDESDLPSLLELDDPESSSSLPVGLMTLQEMETSAIREAMRRTGGNRAQAAEILGIHRNALIRRLDKLGEGHDESSGNG